jgi:hypothetical protein
MNKYYVDERLCRCEYFGETKLNDLLLDTHGINCSRRRCCGPARRKVYVEVYFVFI